MTSPQRESHFLEQASVVLKEDGKTVTITNHSGFCFDITLRMFEQISEAYEEACRNLCSLGQSAKSQDTMNDDLKAYDICSVSYNEKLRLVVRKNNKRIYISCGIYEESPRGQFLWNAKKNFRLDYFSDDLSAVVRDMKQKCVV